MDFIVENYNVIATLITAAVGIYLAISTRRKGEADAAQSISNAASNMVDAQTRQLGNMELDKIEAEDYALYLLHGIERLHTQLKVHKLRPVFTPKSINKYKKPHV